MDLKVPIKISDEVGDEIVDSTGLLDLASGEILRIEYEDYDLEGRGLPADSEDYDFTVGTLSNNGKDVEFKIDVNRVTGQYSVSASAIETPPRKPPQVSTLAEPSGKRNARLNAMTGRPTVSQRAASATTTAATPASRAVPGATGKRITITTMPTSTNSTA